MEDPALAAIRRNAPARPACFVDAEIPIPECLIEAVGYGREARYVGVYWTGPTENDLAWFDGMDQVAGVPLNGWLTFAEHPAVAPFLAQFYLGRGQLDAESMFIVDRRCAKAWIAPLVAGMAFLCGAAAQQGCRSTVDEAVEDAKEDGLFEDGTLTPDVVVEIDSWIETSYAVNRAQDPALTTEINAFLDQHAHLSLYRCLH
jgi:hypothetical protein